MLKNLISNRQILRPRLNSFLCCNFLALSLCLGLVFTPSLNLLAAEKYSINLDEVELSEFIDSVGRITQTTFLSDPRVRGKVSIRSQQKLSADEVYQVFLSQLRVNGFAVVALSDGTQKIVPEQTARLEPIPVEDAQNPISSGKDLLATRVLALKSSDAAQLVNILTPLMDRRIGVITHYQPTNLLILTDWGTNLERLTNLVERIDQVSSENLSLIPLEHAAAADMEKLLSQLLRREGKGGQAPQLMSDERLNLLIIKADKATREEVQHLVAQLDQPVERSANTQVFYLRHAKAADLAKLLRSLAGEVLDEQAEKSPSKQKSSIQEHESTNALVITGSPDQLREMRLLIDQLDIPRAQVLVEAIIVEVSDDFGRELGVNWLFADTNKGSVPLVSGNFGGSLGGIMAGAAAGGEEGALAALGETRGITAGVGRLSKSGLSFAVLANALQKNTQANILATPSILTLDNAEASILVGEEVPFITGSYSNTSGSENPFTTIQRQEIGVRLQITPQINDGNGVRLEILQEVSNVKEVAGASDLGTSKSEIKTTVMAENGEIIVLGGLIREDDSRTETKVPFLGDIPLLGTLFRSSSVRKDKRNLMVFIKPQILQDAASLSAVTSEKYQYMRAAHLLKKGAATRLAPWPEAPLDTSTKLEDIFPSTRQLRANSITGGSSSSGSTLNSSRP